MPAVSPPVGSWSASVALDIASRTTPDHTSLAQAALWLMALGMPAAIAATALIVTEAKEARTACQERSRGLTRSAALLIGAAALTTASFLMRVERIPLAATGSQTAIGGLAVVMLIASIRAVRRARGVSSQDSADRPLTGMTANRRGGAPWQPC